MKYPNLQVSFWSGGVSFKMLGLPEKFKFEQWNEDRNHNLRLDQVLSNPKPIKNVEIP